MASSKLCSVLLLVSLLVSLLALSAVVAEEDISAPFPGVVDLDSSNFDTFVGKEQAVLVEVYAPWCGWCKRLAPNYKQVATLVTNSAHAKDVTIAKVNADKNGILADRFGVRGFPTILFFKKGSLEPLKYSGDRSVVDLIKFINTEASVKIPDGTEPPAAAAAPEGAPTPAPASASNEEKKSGVQILTPDNFDRIVLDSNKHVLVNFFAPWCGHCKRLAPLYDELAAKFSNDPDVVIAKIDASEYQEIGSRFGIRGFPTIKLFPKTNKTGLDMQGSRDLASLEKFINDNRAAPAADTQNTAPPSRDEL